MSSESWSRSTSSRTTRKRSDRHCDDSSAYERDRRRRDRRHSPDRDRRHSPDRDRRHSPDRDRHRDRGGTSNPERDRYRSYDDDRDGRHRREKSSRRHQRSRSKSRSSSYESSRRRKSYKERSRSTEKKSYKSHSTETSNIKILRASRSRSKSQNKSTTNEQTERRNNYFESFRTNNVDSSSIIGNIDESDFDREKIHKEMQERLSLHLAREGKVYPPPKPQASHPIFANDGSFLETFKKLQVQQKQQINEPMTATISVAQQQQYQKPMFSKRRGGKILKTGIVQKPKVTDETVTEQTPNDAWSLYLQEVKKYKNVSCDADSKTRPLVK